MFLLVSQMNGFFSRTILSKYYFILYNVCLFEQDSDGERISPINEEIEESLFGADENDNQGKDVKPLKLFSPGDTLVLEFKPIQPRGKTMMLVYNSKICVGVRI